MNKNFAIKLTDENVDEVRDYAHRYFDNPPNFTAALDENTAKGHSTYVRLRVSLTDSFEWEFDFTIYDAADFFKEWQFYSDSLHIVGTLVFAPIRIH